MVSCFFSAWASPVARVVLFDGVHEHFANTPIHGWIGIMVAAPALTKLKVNSTKCMKTTHLKVRQSVIALLFIGSIAAAVWAAPSRAAGLLIADGGFGGVLEIKEHSAQGTINNGIAVTKVTQVFHNSQKRQVDALYTFPVPRGASVANFSISVNGTNTVRELLDNQLSRDIH